MDRGPWTLDRGLWTLDSGPWTLDRGLWTLDSGPWTWTLDWNISSTDTLACLAGCESLPMREGKLSQFADFAVLHFDNENYLDLLLYIICAR